MNTLTFAHISDLHLPFEPRLTPRQRLSKQQLSAWSWRRRRAWQRPEILDALRSAMDPAFLPRPLRKVEQLPRNETGKLPRAALLAALNSENSREN